MKKTLFLITLCSAGLAVAETVVPMTAQTDLNVTIYNDDRALVRDERQVTVSAGINELAFAGVSADLIPQTALLSGKGLTAREQNFNFDLLTQDSLLMKSVGQTVQTEYIHPATGAVKTGTATLLAYNHGKPVLKIGDRIETSYPGRIIFDRVPENLRATPTLVATVQADQAVTEPVQLDYLTKGLAWQADYVARLNADETKMNLNGFVTLTNRSGIDYNNARLQLVAGEVNLVHEAYAEARPMMMKAGADFAANTAGMAAEALSDFYLYTVPNRTTLLSNQTKQVALLSGSDIAVQKTYELENFFSVYNDEVKREKPEIYLTFDNKQENKLGIPLPKGVIRLYRQDAGGQTQFVGEDRIDHTADREQVRLKMGKAFNLTADMTRSDYRKLSEDLESATFRVTLKNSGDSPAQVVIRQNFPDHYDLFKQSVIGKTLTSNRTEWTISVPAKGEAELRFGVRWGRIPPKGKKIR